MFGEDQSRYIIISNDGKKLIDLAKKEKVFIQKIGIGLSVGLLGLLLSLAGYISSDVCLSIMSSIDQPDSAITTIRICMGLIPSLLVSIGLFIMRDWIDKDSHLQSANS